MLPVPPPPGPLPLADDDLWGDEGPAAPAASLPPAPPLPAASEPAPVPGPPASVPQAPVTQSAPVPVQAAPVQAAPVQQAPVQQQAMQPMQGTNLAGQAMAGQPVMYGGQAQYAQQAVMQVPVPMATKEPKERPPMSHMLVAAGFGALVFAAFLMLLAGFALPPDIDDYDLTDEVEANEYADDVTKHERWQDRYTNLALFSTSIGPIAVAAGLLLYTTKEADDLPDAVRAVLIGGVLYFLAQLFGGGASLGDLLALL